MRRDPIEAEFFLGEGVDEVDKGHSDSLVREVVQNALDAASGDGPVKLRFADHTCYRWKWE